MALTDITTGKPPHIELTETLTAHKELAKLDYENTLLKSSLNAAVQDCQKVIMQFTAEQLDVADRMNSRITSLTTANTMLGEAINHASKRMAESIAQALTVEIQACTQSNTQVIDKLAQDAISQLRAVSVKAHDIFEDYEQQRKRLFAHSLALQILILVACVSCVGSFALLLLGRFIG